MCFLFVFWTRGQKRVVITIGYCLTKGCCKISEKTRRVEFRYYFRLLSRFLRILKKKNEEIVVHWSISITSIRLYSLMNLCLLFYNLETAHVCRRHLRRVVVIRFLAWRATCHIHIYTHTHLRVYDERFISGLFRNVSSSIPSGLPPSLACFIVLHSSPHGLY